MLNKIESYLIFADSDRLLTKFFKKGFKHVDVMLADDENYYFIQCKMRQFRIEKYKKNPFFIAKLATKYKVVKVRVDDMKDKSIPYFNFLSCTQLAKHIAGLSHIRAITPYQLYKQLMKLKKKGLLQQYKSNIDYIEAVGAL